MKCVLTFLSIFLALSLFANHPYSFSKLSLEDGLSQISVLCSHQDSKGYIWFGTRNGLNKFNGYGFQVFLNEAGSLNRISDNHILCITEDNKNNLWVGTNNGLNKLDLSTNQFKQYFSETGQSNHLKNNTISALLFDKKANLWIGTYNGLSLYTPETDSFQLINPDGVFTNNPINSLCIDNDVLLIGTSFLGTIEYNMQTKTYKINKEASENANVKGSNNVRAIFRDSRENLWIGTNGGGLKFRKKGEKNFIPFTESTGLTNNYIRCIAESPEGDILVGTFNGLNLIKGSSGEIVQYNNYDLNRGGLAHFSIFTILYDRNETLWVGSYAGGINYYSPYEHGFQFYNPSVENNSLLGLIGPMVQSGPFIYVATEGGGLLEFDIKKEKFKQYKLVDDNSQSYGQNILKSLYIDGNSILCGTNVGTLYRFDLQTKKFTFLLRLEEESSIYSIQRDSSDNLLIGSVNRLGLTRFSKTGHATTHFPLKGGDHVIFPNVRCILEIKKNIFLIGTRLDGLFRYDANNHIVVQYKHEPGNAVSGKLTANYITNILKDSKGNIWVGTFGGGLCLFDPDTGRFTTFGKEDELQDQNICAMLEGSNNHLWISTISGIFDFDPQAHSFKYYTKSNGISINEFSPHAGLRLSDGRLLFSGDNGFVSFNPQNLFLNPFIPPVVLDNIVVNNNIIVPKGNDNILKKQIGWTKTIQLKYDQSNIEISYSALNFISANRNTYKYKLEKFDDDWIDAGTRRIAYYTNIPPGKYIFRVKASNNDGVWNEEGASLTIIIQPPFWKTWWAYLIYIFLFVLTFVWVILYFRKRERRKNDIRFERKMELEEEKHRKETEKIEQEIVQLKNEHLELEVKHKSQELANNTMNLIRKNEMLMEIRNGLSKLIPDLKPIDNSGKLQRQIFILNSKINDNIQNDDALNKFEEHFDFVHDKFIRRLSEKYPDFSSAEKKMCVFIKMGLSSKEIAPLMNLTIRGAETIRYKLRKKFQLNREEGLTAFLNNF